MDTHDDHGFVLIIPDESARIDGKSSEILQCLSVMTGKKKVFIRS